MKTMTNPAPRTRRATRDDVSTVGRILTSAFFDDPVFGWCLPETPRRADALPSFFELVAEALLAHDEIHIDATGRGAALWVPPGAPTIPPDASAAFEEQLVGILGADGERTFQIVELLESNHPSEPHHYLWFVGVESGAQGSGIGSALLASMLERCDRLGSAAYLEATSEHNRRLYERHGFEVTRELSVPGSPPLWAMWRSPGAGVTR
jgi:ribosomal protein S18 acetylase RimI-like enzyme